MNEFTDKQEGREAILAVARHAVLRLPERPRLAPWLTVVDLGDGRIQLRSAELAHTLTHPLLIEIFRRIEPVLDGRHAIAEIVSSVESDILPTTVVFVLKLLQGKGLLQPGVGESALEENEQARWLKQLQFLSHFVPDASSAHGMLAKARVGLVGQGALRQAILSALESIGIVGITELSEPSTWCTQARSEPAGFDLIVACAESPAFAFFDAVNRACLSSGTRWLRVCISGTTAQLGPTIIPNQTACYMCLDLRLRTHQPELDGYLAYQARIDSHTDEGRIAPLWSAVAGQVALELMRLLTGFAPPVTVGRFYQLTAASPIAIPHDVLRVPRCQCCGRRRTVAGAWDQDLAAMDIEA